MIIVRAGTVVYWDSYDYCQGCDDSYDDCQGGDVSLLGLS